MFSIKVVIGGSLLAFIVAFHDFELDLEALLVLVALFYLAYEVPVAIVLIVVEQEVERINLQGAKIVDHFERVDNHS